MDGAAYLARVISSTHNMFMKLITGKLLIDKFAVKPSHQEF